MIRKLLGGGVLLVLLVLPAVLTAQAPVAHKVAPAKPALAHGIATQVQGDVVAPEETGGQSNQEGLDEGKGQKDQESVDEPNGPENQEAVDHHEGLDQQDGPNDQVGDQTGGDQGSAAAPPAQNSQIGRHKP